MYSILKGIRGTSVFRSPPNPPHSRSSPWNPKSPHLGIPIWKERPLLQTFCSFPPHAWAPQRIWAPISQFILFHFSRGGAVCFSKARAPEAWLGELKKQCWQPPFLRAQWSRVIFLYTPPPRTCSSIWKIVALRTNAFSKPNFSHCPVK